MAQQVPANVSRCTLPNVLPPIPENDLEYVETSVTRNVTGNVLGNVDPPNLAGASKNVPNNDLGNTSSNVSSNVDSTVTVNG